MYRTITPAIDTIAHSRSTEVSYSNENCYSINDAALTERLIIKRNPHPQLLGKLLADVLALLSAPPNRDTQVNQDWVRENRTKYRGRWVALRNGQLLASASSVDELVDQLSDTLGVFLTAIY